MHEQKIYFEQEIQDFGRKLSEDIPASFAENKKELESWKRWFVRIQRDFEDMKNRQFDDSKRLQFNIREHINHTNQNLTDIKNAQTKLTRDGEILKIQMTELQEDQSKVWVKQQVSENQIFRQKEDFEARI